MITIDELKLQAEAASDLPWSSEPGTFFVEISNGRTHERFQIEAESLPHAITSAQAISRQYVKVTGISVIRKGGSEYWFHRH